MPLPSIHSVEEGTDDSEMRHAQTLRLVEEVTETVEEADEAEATQSVVPARDASQLDPLTPAQEPLQLPPVSLDELPAYSPHLARDELRLISTVHLDQNHPSAAFFSMMTASAISANPLASPPPMTDEQTTGGKKMRVTITCGAERTDNGPMFIRIGRGGVIEGKIQLGKVDHGTSLEVSVSLQIIDGSSIPARGLLTGGLDHRIGQYQLLFARPIHVD